MEQSQSGDSVDGMKERASKVLAPCLTALQDDFSIDIYLAPYSQVLGDKKQDSFLFIKKCFWDLIRAADV